MQRMITLLVGMMAVIGMLCSAGSAQGMWAKYQHTDPAFTIDFPSGWLVGINDNVAEFTAGELKLAGKVAVNFETKAPDNRPVSCGVTVYALPDGVTGTKLQGTLKSLITADNGLTLKRFKGQSYFRVDSVTQGITSWHSYLLGEQMVYDIYLKVPTELIDPWQCSQAYQALMNSFTAPDWPLKLTGAGAPTTPVDDSITITMINYGSRTVVISLNQSGKKYENQLKPNEQRVITLAKGLCTGFWGFFANGMKVQGTDIVNASDTLDASETWVFREGPSPKVPSLIASLRQRVTVPKPADAQGTWLKYAHLAPSFSVEFPGGWTVVGGEKAPDLVGSQQTMTAKARMSYDFGAAPNKLRASVTVYTAPGPLAIEQLLFILNSIKQDPTAAPIKRSMLLSKGTRYIQEELPSAVTFTIRCYQISGDTLYMLSMEAPIALEKQSRAGFDHMLASLVIPTYTPPGQPIFPPGMMKGDTSIPGK